MVSRKGKLLSLIFDLHVQSLRVQLRAARAKVKQAEKEKSAAEATAREIQGYIIRVGTNIVTVRMQLLSMKHL